MPVRKIEIDFALPVELSGEEMRVLDRIADQICKRNCPDGWAFWASGFGSKPNFSKADSLFLGKPVDPDAPETGEPTWDDSIFHIDCAARELYPEEIEERRTRDQQGGGPR